jgi:two-component system chemotaxis sensor kinase CheA
MAWRIELELLGDADRNTLDEAFMFVQDVAVVSIEALEPDDVAPELRIADSTASSPSEGKSARSSTEAATIRVATEKIDKLVDLVGELVIAHSAVRELSKHPTPERLASLQEAVLQTERHLRELQERVMSVRMVPMGTVFSRLARTVREASGKLGKQVQLELDGNDTELDKGLAERLGDPLLHLVRNAVDHGLESPEARAAAGKPSVGKLRIVARPRGGSVVVEVSDDGRGLNREKILKRAIERGLVASDAVLTDEQIYALISSAGFSTAETVTDLSGRGVGLDVVKRNIAEMGGDLTIRSEPGRGSTFTIRLPLTLTIMEGLLLKAGNTVCVVPLVDVAFSLRLRPEQQRSLAGLGQILDLPGESLPILELVDLLSLPPRSGGGELAVVLQTGSHRYALRVDALLGQTQVVVKSLETHFRRLPGILGATILGDGRVALILDGAGLAAVAGLDVNERLQAPTLLTHAETNSWN